LAADGRGGGDPGGRAAFVGDGFVIVEHFRQRIDAIE